MDRLVHNAYRIELNGESLRSNAAAKQIRNHNEIEREQLVHCLLLTHVDNPSTMKLPASLSSDPYRRRIGTLYFLQRNPHSNSELVRQLAIHLARESFY